VIALLVNPNNPLPEPMIRDLQEAAREKKLQLHILKAGSEGEINAAFATLVELHAGALVLGPDPFLNSRREQLITLVKPTIFSKPAGLSGDEPPVPVAVLVRAVGVRDVAGAKEGGPYSAGNGLRSGPLALAATAGRSPHRGRRCPAARPLVRAGAA